MAGDPEAYRGAYHFKAGKLAGIVLAQAWGGFVKTCATWVSRLSWLNTCDLQALRSLLFMIIQKYSFPSGGFTPLKRLIS